MPPPYSKSRIDRAGQAIAQNAHLLAEPPDTLSAQAALRQMLDAVAVIDWWRSEHAKPLSRVAANLRYYVAQEGDPVVTQRLKRVPTIAGKLLREPNMKLSRMADIGGVRAILPDQETAYRIARLLRRNWTITRVRDYVGEPKDDGYRALHLINRHRGRLIEIQLRTPLQDEWANLVEKLSRTAFPGLKFGKGPVEVRDILRENARVMAKVDQELGISFDEFVRVPERTAQMVDLIDQANEP
jgi:putative GTP pyrophosphokinase